MSTISASTTSTTAFKITTDTTGALVFQTGSSPTTALTLGSDQSVTFAGAVTASGNQTVTGNLTVNGNTTVGDASTDTATVNATTTFVAYPNLPNTFGFKNRLINPGMVIDQRNAGASVTPANGDYTVDRWQALASQTGKYTLQQVSDAPTGFKNSIKVTSTSAYSVISTDRFMVRQLIEGNNWYDLAWGTSSAAAITISFWVKSSLTGYFGGSVVGDTGVTASYTFGYTISSANTWEQKTITIPGYTLGTWTSGTSTAVQIEFGFGVGSNRTATANAWNTSSFDAPPSTVSVVGTNGATFYLTGVQLEKGSTATSFDFRDYGRELALCQRYYSTNFNVGVAPSQGGSSDNRPCFGTVFNSTDLQGSEIAFPVAMRATPSITFYRPSFISTDGNWGVYPMHWSGGGFVAAVVSATYLRLVVGGSVTGGTNYNAYIMSGYFAASAEL